MTSTRIPSTFNPRAEQLQSVGDEFSASVFSFEIIF